MLHGKEVCDLYRSPSIVMIVKPRRLLFIGHVDLTEETHTEFWWGNFSESDHLED
jgi:hypothetical protein